MKCTLTNPVKDRYSWKPVCQTCGRRLTHKSGRWTHTRWFGMV